MICLLVASLAANAGSLRDAHVFTSDTATAVEDVAVAPDGTTFAFVDAGADRLWVVRTDTWQAYPAPLPDSCTGIVGLGAYQNGYAIGCGDGGVAFVDTSLRKPGLTPVMVPAVAGTPILGVTADDTNVYVTAENKDTGGSPVVIAVSIADHERLEGGWPATLSYAGYVDSETDGDFVIIAHGADNVSKVDATTGGAIQSNTSISSADCRDVDADDLSVLLACGGGILELNTSTNDLSIVLGFDKDWSRVESLWIDDLEDELWFFDAEDGLFVYDYDAASGTVSDDLIGSVPGALEPSEMAGVPGYAFLGTDGGDVHVYTHLPWIDVEPIDGDKTNGDVVDVTFTSDTDGQYEVMFGATLLGKGDVVEGVPVTLPVTIGDAFIEGENIIIVTVVDGVGDQGHGGVSVQVNNPPSQVVLQDGDLGWGDATLYLTIRGIDDEDLKMYRVYWSPTEFDPTELVPGTAPPADMQTADFAAKPGESLDVPIEGLTNETTYYVAVRAIDMTNLEGPMSIVLSGTPHETFSASELAGDEGGYTCASTRSRAPIPALILLVGLAALGRRGSIAALALLVLGGTARAQDDDTSDDTSTETSDTTETSTTETTETSTTETTSTPPPPTTPPPAPPPPTPPPQTAEAPVAAEPGTVTVLPAKEKHQKYTAGIELRFGPLWFDGNNPINDVYGSSGNNLLMFEGGPSFRDILELDFGVGRYHRRGNLVAEDGSQSNDESVITTFPLTLSGKVRLDFLEEQWVVPMVSAGLDYWLWNEKAGYDSDAMQWDAKQNGGHYGYHYAAGLQILLDIFEPRRASLIHARSGINDSYIVVEYRHREVGENEEGLKFTGSEVTVGLRIGF